METRYGMMVFALIALISLAYADTPECGVFGNHLQNGICVPDLLINISTVLLFIGFFILAAAYMIGTSLDSHRLTSWVENEFYQLLGTAVVVVFYLGIVGTMNWLGPAFAMTNLAYPGNPTSRAGGTDWVSLQTNWVSVQTHSQTYMGCLFDYTKKSIKSVLTFIGSIGAIGALTINLSISGTTFYTPILPGMGGAIQIFSMAVGMIAATAVQLKLQMAILGAWLGFFNVLLPLGIIFRSFPLTRPAGAALIAISIGFTVLLPLTYLVVEDIGYQMSNPHKNVCNDSPPTFSGLTKKLFNLAYSSAIGKALDEMDKAFSIGGWLQGMAFRLVIEATVMPMFAYLLVLNITKRLAELLGGEIDFSTLVRLI